ncbi:MAG: D-aminoacyl-tRNA deacylase [Candidatus Nanopelagicales bacterium]
MRALVQRVDGARVDVGQLAVGEIQGPGLVVLVGVTHTDTERVARRIAIKVFDLRIFDSAELTARDICVPPGSSRQLSARDAGLPLLVISQFTLYADTTKGRRPTWNSAAPADIAEPLVEQVVKALQGEGATVETGKFGADMRVSLVNDGPITIMVEESAAPSVSD